MRRLPPDAARLLGALVLALAAACSCNERTTGDQHSDGDSGTLDSEARSLCVALCDRKQRCAENQGATLDEAAHGDCVDGCVDSYFRSERSLCREAAEYALRCESEAKCAHEVPPAEPGRIAICEDEKYPWSVCRAGPDEFIDRGCNVERCLSGECCSDPPSMRD